MAENLDIIMPMYNLIEYSHNCADSSGSLYQFKRDESPMNDARNHLNVAFNIFFLNIFEIQSKSLRKRN